MLSHSQPRSFCCQNSGLPMVTPKVGRVDQLEDSSTRPPPSPLPRSGVSPQTHFTRTRVSVVSLLVHTVFTPLSEGEPPSQHTSRLQTHTTSSTHPPPCFLGFLFRSKYLHTGHVSVSQDSSRPEPRTKVQTTRTVRISKNLLLEARK